MLRCRRAWVMTARPRKRPTAEEVVEIGFVEGRPVSVDGMPLDAGADCGAAE